MENPNRDIDYGKDGISYCDHGWNNVGICSTCGMKKEDYEKEKDSDKIEFKTLGKKERKILLTALSIDLQNLKCQGCSEKVSYEDCCIMPSIGTKGEATILCNSPLCMAEYLESLEDFKGNKKTCGSMAEVFLEEEYSLDELHEISDDFVFNGQKGYCSDSSGICIRFKINTEGKMDIKERFMREEK